MVTSIETKVCHPPVKNWPNNLQGNTNIKRTQNNWISKMKIRSESCEKRRHPNLAKMYLLLTTPSFPAGRVAWPLIRLLFSSALFFSLFFPNFFPLLRSLSGAHRNNRAHRILSNVTYWRFKCARYALAELYLGKEDCPYNYNILLFTTFLTPVLL